MRAPPRLACFPPMLWPGLTPSTPPGDGAGLTLPCGPHLPVAPPDARRASLGIGGRRLPVTGSGRYGPCWLHGPAGGFPAEVTVWIFDDGHFAIEPIGAPPEGLALESIEEVTLGPHLGADARIAAQLLGPLHRVQIGRGALIDTLDGPRPIEMLTPGTRIATLATGPQPLAAALAARGSGRGLAAPYRLAAEAFGNARAMTLPARARLLAPEAPWEAPRPIESFTPHKGLQRAPAPAVDWVILGFSAPQIIAAQGAFLATCPPPMPRRGRAGVSAR
ncbi:MAG: Hint domain-containing protein [Paenirhodobacter sp.]|uniref:Hint domain-containing protein n=1 Tax=Paenirhodobacter sp. TaxID=1965326 RepID=UPI003D0BA64D